MADNDRSDEDDNKKKEEENTPAETASTEHTRPASEVEPILEAKANSAAKGFLFAQILRGAAAGVARGLMDDFLDGS